MKPKTIIGEVAEELKEIVKETGKAGKKQAAEGVKEVVASLTGSGGLSADLVRGQEGALDPSEIEKRRIEEEREKASLRRVIEEARRAGQRVESDKVVPLAEKKPKEMKIVKPPGDLKRRLPSQKPVKGRAEIKDFQTG